MPASVTAVPGGLSGMGEAQQREAEVQTCNDRLCAEV